MKDDATLMTLAPEVLEILRCPESLQRLAPAPREVLDRLGSGPARDRAGNPVTVPLEGGLLREDGAVLYPIRGGIPILLVENGIRGAGEAAEEEAARG